MSKYVAGRHFLQTPGPTNVPDRILRAMHRAPINHRGPEWGAVGLEVVVNLRKIFGTEGNVAIYPASGTGAWEAALLNTLSPGDKVLMSHTGWFAHLWVQMARKLGLEPVLLETDWRRGADVAAIEERLNADKSHQIRAVCVVHNETSTSCMTHVLPVREAMNRAAHPALLMVDAISSLACSDFQHDAWGVDVTIAGSQKGLMVPPGLSFNAISAKALEATKSAKLPRSYWDWEPLIAANSTGFFPYTPAENLMFALNEGLKMLLEEGLPNVYARHERFAEATRRAVRAWDMELQCQDAQSFSPGVTAIRTPDGHSADNLRNIILEKFNMALGNGLGQINDKVFRIGHMGDLGELQLLGALSGVEMGMRVAGMPHKSGGVQTAMDYLAGNA